jgi:hypothetical protein
MVMEAVVATFEGRRDEIRARAEETRGRLGAVGRIEPDSEPPEAAALREAVQTLESVADTERGGFGRGAPKFPPASALELLIATGVAGGASAGDGGAAAIVETTLDAMMAGGIYDQLGGGFARYAVDADWLVPHFEKMLYDNALLARVYLHGWQALGHDRWRRVCVETLDWALREMRGSEGGFFSALDADSEGEEGRYYLWSAAQIREALADAGLPDAVADAALEHYGATDEGNFEGANVLHLPGGADGARRVGQAMADKVAANGIEEARRALLAAREKRVRPGLDDKRLASWNALMVAALADAGAVLGRADYLDAARTCAGFLLEEMRDDEGRLLRTYKDGEARLNAYLEDHAFLLEALLVLYEATFEASWYERARELAETMISRFGDGERGGFFSTASDHEELIARRKEVGDHPIPSGNSSAALGLLRLAALSGERSYEERAEGVFRLFGATATRHPDGFGHMLRALDFHLSPTREVALVGADLHELAAVVRSRMRPHLVLAGGPGGGTVPELLRDRTAVAGAPAAYVCESFACRTPTTDPAELAAQLGDG